MRLSILVFAAYYVSTALGKCAWDTCNALSTDPSVLNVHLIPHSHDDLGWLITVDQYYQREVSDIYSTVVAELEKGTTRRFSFAETGYLMRWVEHNAPSTVARLQRLVANGQVELIGGGWVQNDEAASHYVDIIDQMTLGFEHLKTLFGEECGSPKAAWQIDPFGHSREFASLVAQMGHQSLWFGRLHYIDREQRHQRKENELLWIGSDDLRTSILTGAFWRDYSPPPNFCFDVKCSDEEIQDDPSHPNFNVDRRAKEFVDLVSSQAQHYMTKNVLLTMGMDFQYTNATKWYTNLDKLIKFINAQSQYKMNLVYSTPACYAEALKQSGAIFPSKRDDFFPYASAEHSFWTGYFTSRPAFKGMIRQASSFLNLGRQLTAQFDLSDDAALEIAKRASALVQHHDAVTGTAKQVVTYDYAKQLDNGMKQLETFINHGLQKIGAVSPTYKLCILANETVCEVTRDASLVAVTFFNPYGQSVGGNVASIPVYTPNVTVSDYNGATISSQVVTTAVTNGVNKEGAKYTLNFPLDVEPLGYRTFFVSSTFSAEPKLPKSAPPVKASGPATIENNLIRLEVDATGRLQAVIDKRTNVRRALRQEFFYYESMGLEPQPSGAYIFRPAKQLPEVVSDTIQTTIVTGPLVQEIQQTVNGWIQQTIRLYVNQPQIEFDWTIGPIPKEFVPIGKEVITRYTTDIQSNNVFYTDSSGRQMLKRTVNSYPSFPYNNTEPVAGNYYPVTNRIYIKDDKTQLTVLTDRSQGGTSTTGAVELMLHRRCFVDDHFGVDEALDEPGKDGRGLVVRGQHWVVIGDAVSAASIHRPLAVQLFNRPIPAFMPIDSVTGYRQNFITRYSGLTRVLPSLNLNVLTLEKRGANILLRLEHIFQKNEDPNLSKPVQVDISKLFTRFTVTAAQELVLGANRNATTNGVVITLNPQEIKTYLLTVQRKK